MDRKRELDASDGSAAKRARVGESSNANHVVHVGTNRFNPMVTAKYVLLLTEAH